MGKLLNFVPPVQPVLGLNPEVSLTSEGFKVRVSKDDVAILAKYNLQPGRMEQIDVVQALMTTDDDGSLDWVFLEGLLKMAYAKKVPLDIAGDIG